ncbi:MAG TPA: universal stress protein [Tepidisphaeraceae bacterium]|nr:universal stress protein [Tepidisphaeraceae bacterium]
MYDRILITLDATDVDKTILEHIRPLARIMHSKLLLLHVADGWAARLHGADAVSPEVSHDKAYLDRVQAELAGEGFDVESHLAFGDPPTEIVRWVAERGCDLIAMSTHGHRFLADLVLGSTANKVRHRVTVPVLLLKADS